MAWGSRMGQTSQVKCCPSQSCQVRVSMSRPGDFSHVISLLGRCLVFCLAQPQAPTTPLSRVVWDMDIAIHIVINNLALISQTHLIKKAPKELYNLYI